MNETDVEDDFSALFGRPPGAERRRIRQERAAAERRAQQTDAQRRRRAERTAQINFRCAPAFAANVKAAAAEMSARSGQKVAIADVLEDALAAYMAKHGIEATHDE